jgi:hypothetical protein
VDETVDNSGDHTPQHHSTTLKVSFCLIWQTTMDASRGTLTALIDVAHSTALFRTVKYGHIFYAGTGSISILTKRELAILLWEISFFKN